MENFSVKSLDLPPVWTLGGLFATYAVSWITGPFGFGRYGPGLALAALGLAIWLMIEAVAALRAKGTTLNPHGAPSALVTERLFAVSRNPIYLGNVLLVAAAAFWFDTVLGLVIAAGLVWVLTERFIKVEEARLLAGFGETARVWFTQVRRWI